jgi:hypothetical protein
MRVNYRKWLVVYRNPNSGAGDVNDHGGHGSKTVESKHDQLMKTEDLRESLASSGLRVYSYVVVCVVGCVTQVLREVPGLR